MRGRIRRSGHTLIEAVLILALAGFIINAGAFSWRRLEPKFRLQAAVWEAHTILNQARFRAIWSGLPFRVVFEPGGYRLEAYDDQAGTWQVQTAGVFEGADVQANNDPAFYPEGTVSNLASIVVSNTRGAYKITIAMSGRIKVAKIE
jgi:Tfp pilus assembly protein FimT